MKIALNPTAQRSLLEAIYLWFPLHIYIHLNPQTQVDKECHAISPRVTLWEEPSPLPPLTWLQSLLQAPTPTLLAWC